MNQLIMDRVNYLKPKELTKPISYFSSGELDFSNIELAKENSKKISKSISYFSSGELELLKIFNLTTLNCFPKTILNK